MVFHGKNVYLTLSVHFCSLDTNIYMEKKRKSQMKKCFHQINQWTHLSKLLLVMLFMIKNRKANWQYTKETIPPKSFLTNEFTYFITLQENGWSKVAAWWRVNSRRDDDWWKLQLCSICSWPIAQKKAFHFTGSCCYAHNSQAVLISFVAFCASWVLYVLKTLEPQT